MIYAQKKKKKKMKKKKKKKLSLCKLKSRTAPHVTVQRENVKVSCLKKSFLSLQLLAFVE